MSVTNIITLTNYTEITNIITTIPTSNWEKTSTFATILIPVILAIWGIVSEKRKDERKQQKLAFEKSQELEKQKQLSDLADIKEFIEIELIPKSDEFLRRKEDNPRIALHYLNTLHNTWEELVKISKNTIYYENIKKEFDKAHQELNEYNGYLSQGRWITAIPNCTQDLNKLYIKIKG